MMSLRLQVIIAVCLFLGLVVIINLIRKRKLELKYALIWMLLIVGLALIIFIPGLLDALAEVLGIYSVMNMIFFIGFIFAIILIFSLTMALSRNSERVRKMAQRMALNEYEMKHRGNKDESDT